MQKWRAGCFAVHVHESQTASATGSGRPFCFTGVGGLSLLQSSRPQMVEEAQDSEARIFILPMS